MNGTLQTKSAGELCPAEEASSLEVVKETEALDEKLGNTTGPNE